jgi:hypothetical protein
LYSGIKAMISLVLIGTAYLYLRHGGDHHHVTRAVACNELDRGTTRPDGFLVGHSFDHCATGRSKTAASRPAPASQNTPSASETENAQAEMTPAGDKERPQRAATAVSTIPPPIVSNFDTAALTIPAWETGVRGGIPPSSAPDVLGAFRFICAAGHLSYDDPIVFPRQPGKSHLHQFFGNSSVRADSTYESLRSAGASTCMNPLNRSGYWIPAMLTGKGKVVRPDFISIYYKRLPESSPSCAIQGTRCVELPRGLRFVFGYNMLNPKASPTGTGYYNCQGRGVTQGHYPSIIEAAQHCPTGAQLGLVIHAPDCWDGAHLDSPDHRSHMAYAFRQPGVGILKCPADHPLVVPTFTLSAWYTTDASLDMTGKPSWHLSSDEMVDGMTMTPGTTMHADWFGAWDDRIMAVWMANCINKMLNCSGGDLGNGMQLRQTGQTPGHALPRLVDLPRRP